MNNDILKETKNKNFNMLKRKTMDLLIKTNIGNKCGMFDKEMGPILAAINAEPHVFTFQSCYGHEESEPKYWDNRWNESKGEIWLCFNGELPTDCPFPNEILKDREIVPVLEIFLKKRCLEDWIKLLEWIRTKNKIEGGI